MEELFIKFCRYYVLKGTESELNELKELSKDNFKEYQKKALKFAKNLRHKTAKMGFTTDFESFCNMLEEYIEQKDKMTDSEKRNYLKILLSLSKVHNIDLREELERYVSYKEVKKSDLTPEDIFKRFCRYNLNNDAGVEKFNELKDLASSLNIDFKEIQQKSISFIEEIKMLTEKLGFNTDEESIYLMVEEYKKKKSQMTDSEKASYLRILLYLSEIYEVNIRELIVTKKTEKNITNKTTILTKISNPLDNEDLLDEMLKARFFNGNFDIENIFSKENEFEINANEIYKIQANLIFKLYRIFLDKMNNYAYDDLNIKYTSLITDEEISKLENLGEEEIYNIIIELNKNEQKHYICKKYKLTENLFNFLSLSITEATNFNNELINKDYSLFNFKDEQPTISIYLCGEPLTISKILSEYIKSCVQKALWYEIKRSSKSNTYILYASINDFKDKIKILNSLKDKINIKNMNINPICGNISDSFYGISFAALYGNNDYSIPYFEYINEISEISYYRVLAKLVINKIKEENDINIIENFITLNNFKVSIKNYLDITCNNIQFNSIKDLINQNIPLIINTLEKYITDDSKRDNLVLEFKKSLLYLSNLINNKDKKSKTNICLNVRYFK